MSGWTRWVSDMQTNFMGHTKNIEVEITYLEIIIYFAILLQFPCYNYPAFPI